MPLWLSGRDLRRWSLLRRKAKLRSIRPDVAAPILFATHVDTTGTKLFAAAREYDLEGIVAKRKDSPYECGERVTSWVKIRNSLGRTREKKTYGRFPVHATCWPPWRRAYVHLIHTKCDPGHTMRIEAEHPKCHWTLVYVNPDNAQNVMVATKRVLRCYNCAKDLVRVATEDWKKRHAESQPVAFWDMAFRYLMADKPDKAMDWVEKGFEMHDPLMTYNTTPARYFDRLFGNPRFIAICERMKLPLPE